MFVSVISFFVAMVCFFICNIFLYLMINQLKKIVSMQNDHIDLIKRDLKINVNKCELMKNNYFDLIKSFNVIKAQQDILLTSSNKTIKDVQELKSKQ